jgi:hypothetical protein
VFLGRCAWFECGFPRGFGGWAPQGGKGVTRCCLCGRGSRVVRLEVRNFCLEHALALMSAKTLHEVLEILGSYRENVERLGTKP